MKKFIISIIVLVASISVYAEEPLWTGRYRISGTGYCLEMQEYTSSMPDWEVTVAVYDDCITVDGQVHDYVRSVGYGTKVYRSSLNNTDYLYYVRLDRTMYLETTSTFYVTTTIRYDMEPLD